jgi:hypothetical protein
VAQHQTRVEPREIKLRVRETSEVGSCQYVGGEEGWLVALLGTPASSALEQIMHKTLPDSRSRITCACAFFVFCFFTLFHNN